MLWVSMLKQNTVRVLANIEAAVGFPPEDLQIHLRKLEAFHRRNCRSGSTVWRSIHRRPGKERRKRSLF